MQTESATDSRGSYFTEARQSHVRAGKDWEGKVVGRRGLEPRTNGLKGHCSTG